MFRSKLKDGTTKIEGKPLTAYDAINLFFPVNSIKISVDNVNPGTYLTGTTWVAWGAGRAVVGVGSNGTNTYTTEQTFGADTCTLTAAQCGVNAHTHAHTLAAPSHTHPVADHTHGLDWNHVSGANPSGTTVHFAVSIGGTFNTDGTDSSGITDPDGPGATTGPSATALTGAMGAVSGASSATAHDIRMSSIATYIWKRTA